MTVSTHSIFKRANKINAYVTNDEIAFGMTSTKVSGLSGYEYAWRNSCNILNKYIETVPFRNPTAHAPFLAEKSACFSIEQWLKPSFETNSENKFRANNNIHIFGLYSYYYIHNGLAHKIFFNSEKNVLLECHLTDNFQMNNETFQKIIHTKPKFICMNVSG